MKRFPLLAPTVACLLVMASCGDDDKASSISKPSSTLSVTCNAAPASGNAPLDVQFSASATGAKGAVTYAWSLGDGAAASGATVARRYEFGGTYETTVKATDTEGRTATCQKTVTVQSPIRIDYCNPHPAAGFKALEVEFITHVANNEGYLEYEWDFGNGVRSLERQPKYTYKQAGDYNIRLTVRSNTSSATCTNTARVFDDVSADNCFATPQDGAAPLTVQFGVSPSGGDGTYTYEWTFGDATSSDKRNPSHVYPTPGEYTAHVWVESFGMRDGCRRKIVVR
jgi:PKD repeat protein